MYAGKKEIEKGKGKERVRKNKLTETKKEGTKKTGKTQKDEEK